MFTDQLAQVDSLSIKANAMFAWNIKWLIMEWVMNERYRLNLLETEKATAAKNKENGKCACGV